MGVRAAGGATDGCGADGGACGLGAGVRVGVN
jgi:hypothetical protein